MCDRVVLSIPFRMNPLRAVFHLCFAAVAAGYMFYLLMDPPTEPVRLRGFTVSPQLAWWYLAVICAISPVGVLMMAKALYDGLFNPSQVTVTDHSIVLPDVNWRGYCEGSGHFELPLTDVISVDVGTFAGMTRQLKIKHTGGRAIILSGMLPSQQAFDQLARTLNARAG